MANTEHVTLLTVKGGYEIRCTHCGALYASPIPCSAAVFVISGDAFIKAHAKCKAPK